MIIGLVPGAMKPYHAGHHFLTMAALAECDSVIILTTTKDRGPISGMVMLQIWETYIIPNLPAGITVQFTNSPVGEVYDILDRENENPTKHEYRLYGGTEDLARFPADYVGRQYPNVAARFTNVAQSDSASFLRGVGDSPMVKGAWIRKALELGDVTKFTSMMPKFLQPHAEDIFNMLK